MTFVSTDWRSNVRHQCAEVECHRCGMTNALVLTAEGFRCRNANHCELRARVGTHRRRRFA